jgi:hypothetical protein
VEIVQLCAFIIKLGAARFPSFVCSISYWLAPSFCKGEKEIYPGISLQRMLDELEPIVPQLEAPVDEPEFETPAVLLRGHTPIQ